MSNNNQTWKSLHDSTLESVILVWKTGELRIALKDELDEGTYSISIKAINTREFRCPRQFPWGRSVSINEVRGPQIMEGNRKRLEIEVQSGDVLYIEADDIVLEMDQ